RSRAVLPPRLRRDDRSAHSAFRLGPVDAKRVELGELMQKSPGRRRYRDERARISEQDRLSQLTIPGPETEPGAFVAGELELVAELVRCIGDDQHIIADALGKARYFGLDREVAGIGAASTGNKRPRLLLNDPRAELLRGVPYVRSKLPIAVAAADDQQDGGPT